MTCAGHKELDSPSLPNFHSGGQQEQLAKEKQGELGFSDQPGPVDERHLTI